MGTKKLKNDYRHAHTHINEHTVDSGKTERMTRSRERRSGSPSLKQYATTHPDGQAWRDRKRGGG